MEEILYQRQSPLVPSIEKRAATLTGIAERALSLTCSTLLQPRPDLLKVIWPHGVQWEVIWF